VDALVPLGLLLKGPGAEEPDHPVRVLADVVSGFARSVAPRRGGPGAGEPLAREAAELLATLSDLAPQPVSVEIRSTRRRILESLRRRRMAARTLSFLARAAKLTVPFSVALALTTVLVLAWFAGERRANARALDAALLLAKRDPRWAKVEGLAATRNEDFALALRMIGNDLPAFGALDDVASPDARFWARCAAGAGLLSWLTPEGTPVLGRTDIKKAVEETLAADLEGAVERWLEDALEPFPRAQPDPGRGFPALQVKLEVASHILASLKPPGGRGAQTGGLIATRERVSILKAVAESLGGLVAGAGRLITEIGESEEAEGVRLARSFWGRYLSGREGAPSGAWRKLLDCATATVLAREIREKPHWAQSGAAGKGPSVYEALRLIARIREKSGPLPLVPGWSEETDPLYSVLWPLVR
jgi:hypothetical protein